MKKNVDKSSVSSRRLLCLEGKPFPILLGDLYTPEDFLQALLEDKTANCFSIQVVEEGNEKYICCVGKMI